MSTEALFEPMPFARGPAMKNRFMLAPMTNQQSHADGRVSDDEFRSLTMRAAGGFGLTMTAASHVQAAGQGFWGQLGIFDDSHLTGLASLAAAIKAHGSLSSVQLHHAGMRSPAALVGTPVSASDNEEFGARALTLEEVEDVRDAFIRAAVRAEQAGFDGVEVHGAHGYIFVQFLSAETNQRTDRYGGSLENRSRLLFEVIEGIRHACGEEFQLGLRISTEKYGLDLMEVRDVAADVMARGLIDYLDVSLWDVTKEPNDPKYQGRSLMSYFTELPRGNTRLGVAGKIMDAPRAAQVLASGCDFVTIGRAAILRHDFPARVRSDAAYSSPALPVSAAHLESEGLGPAFVDYMRGWEGFVDDEAPQGSEGR